MSDHPRKGTVAAPGSPDFALHTLGWRAFQDLCAAVLREVWAQSVHTFADSNDGGRDGAFHGTWQQPPDPIGVQDVPDGSFVLQCKHTKKADTTLAPSDLDDEFAKVQALVERGLCSSYVLLTNARVSGTSEATIRQRLLDAGVAYPLILDGQWICDTIATRQRLRTFVPRVYGLGDLSHILDERAYNQAQALLGYLRDELATFVVTDAYRHAVQAVQDHGFVLLLGEPAVGKSVIAATLAMTALDAWGCLTVNAHDAEGLVRHWNPHEPNQFFWIDDAFGAVRHEQQLTDSWSRHMRHVMTAVRGGAKVVLTSRDYIYRDARTYLKEYAYPLLHEQQVVVDVAQLPLHERRQILYNHIKLGDQPQDVRARMKPHLDSAAATEPFHPEVARRLGQQAFTHHLEPTEHGITDFMARPTAFLRDLYAELGHDEKAALALTYQAGEQLPAPLNLDASQNDVINRIGSTSAGVSRALLALTGTFLRLASPPGSDSTTGWSFRHPTLQESFAEFMAADPNLLGIFINGLNWRTILTRIDCGTEQQRGTLLRIPPTLYSAVVKRLYDAEPQARGRHAYPAEWYNFFATRCSDTFLRLYTEADPQFVPQLTRLISFLDAIHESKVLARLHQAGLLSPEQHSRIREKVATLAVETPDAAWLRDPEWQILFSKSDEQYLLQRVREDLIPDLDWVLDVWRDNYPSDEEPSRYYSTLQEQLRTYREAFDQDTEVADALDQAIAEVEETIDSSYNDYEPGPDEHPDIRGRINVSGQEHSRSRSIFDDIDS
ncbi:nSTAND3 domain-containing NTPase [Streptomyces coelicoflavus]|uniref:nSTAND3 domain-containing NTPase n=1 Tax=Streptomyces coelicoflavus TaxID=285562 RepID=UPI00363EFEE0